MALYVPRVGLNRMLVDITGDTLTLRLFSNNITPAATDTSSTYTEVTGGGYSSSALSSGSWTIDSSANPATATYNSFVTFTFTGAIGGSGIVYGYYITRASGEVVLSQLFPTSVTPINGSYVKIKPRLTIDNA
jgi:hypothetical protein